MAKVIILTTPGCKNCKKVEEMLDELNVKYSVVDVTKKPEMLAKYPILSAPGIVINGELRFTGAPSRNELEKAVKLVK